MTGANPTAPGRGASAGCSLPSGRPGSRSVHHELLERLHRGEAEVPMRPALTIPTVIVFVLLAFSTAGAAPIAQPVRAPMSWTARPAGPAALTPQEQLWFDRLLAAMTGSEVLVNSIMTTGDTYDLGRAGGDYVESLLMAFRA